MDKIKKISICCIVLLISCVNKGRTDIEGYSLMIAYPDHININYINKSIKINYNDLKYSDILRLTKMQEDIIAKSFNDNKIGEIRGSLFFSDEYPTLPMTLIIIKIYKNQKLYSEITYDFYYNEKGLWPFSQRFRAITFRDELINILENNNEIKKAANIYGKYNDSLYRSHMIN